MYPDLELYIHALTKAFIIDGIVNHILPKIVSFPDGSCEAEIYQTAM